MTELFKGDIALSASPGYRILFDGSRVDEFCIRFNTQISIAGGVNSASVELIYSEAFLNIEFLTDARIFVKNIFTDKYKLVFEGQIRSRQINLSGSQKSIIFNITDYVAWLPKMPVPILFGLIDSTDPLEVFTWLAKGINYTKVSSILTQGQAAFAGLTLRGVVEKIFQIIADSTAIGGAVSSGTPTAVPAKFWSAAVAAGTATGVDPILISAIGKQETMWGTLGQGLNGYSMGYGAYNNGSTASQFQDAPGEFTKQTLAGANKLASGGLGSGAIISGASIRAFNVNSHWATTDGTVAGYTASSWPESVWSIYQELKSSLVTPVTAPASTPAVSTTANSVYEWTAIGKRIKVDSDIFADLLPNNVIDFYFQGALVNDVYTLLSNIVQKLGYEMYQSSNGLIHIKEPMWFDTIPRQNIIDPILINGFSESTNWDQQVSRVIVTGGIEPIIDRQLAASNTQSYYTPAGVFVGLEAGETNTNTAGVFLDINQVNLTNMDVNFSNSVNTGGSLPNSSDASTAGRDSIASYARDVAKRGIRYQFGAGHAGGIGNIESSGLDCSGFVYYCFYNAGFSIVSNTVDGYYQQCRKITSSALQVGDLGFNGIGTGNPHMGIFLGNNTWAEASSTVGKVMVRQLPYATTFSYFGDLVSNISGDTARAVTIAAPQGDLYTKLNGLTDTERKYGMNVLEVQQPLIRVGIQTTEAQKSTAYKELGRYSEYLYHTQNAQANVANISLTASPWLLPGYNCWVDPLGLDRVYYVTAVAHNGDASGVYTTANLTYGRTWDEYSSNFSTPGTGSSRPSDRIDKNRFTDRETPGASVTAKNNTPSEDINPTTSDRDRIQGFLKSYEDTYSKQGVVPATSTNYKLFWGEAVAQQGYSMNRWDYQFTTEEILSMAPYIYYGSCPPANVSLGIALGSMGPIAKNFLTQDSQFVPIPDVIKKRAISVINIIKKAKIEVAARYTQQEG